LDPAPKERRTLKEAIEETIRWRRAENLRDRYLQELESYLRRFALGRGELYVDRIGVAEIEQWFAGRNEALTTRKANMGRLGSMFDVCFRRGYIRDNPILRMASPKLDERTPERFTPQECKVLLCQARKRKTSLAYFVLGMFAGIRPEELAALTWAAVDLKAGNVNIGAEVSKVRKQRIVPLHPTAVAWLKTVMAKASAPIAPPAVTLRRHRRALRARLGKWPQDVLRHTAASYLLALHHDAARVAMWLGNSVRVLDKNYKTPVSAADCKTFWALTPKGVKR
jgi:integrase